MDFNSIQSSCHGRVYDKIECICHTNDVHLHGRVSIIPYFCVKYNSKLHKMRISFHTLGCKLNYSETSQLRDQYEKLGHEIVPFGNETDAVIINTCTVTENA
ncbi:MAG: hypothetical protein ACK5DT_07795, partial [Ignavibacteria bacterium]